MASFGGLLYEIKFGFDKLVIVMVVSKVYGLMNFQLSVQLNFTTPKIELAFNILYHLTIHHLSYNMLFLKSTYGKYMTSSLSKIYMCYNHVQCLYLN